MRFILNVTIPHRLISAEYYCGFSANGFNSKNYHTDRSPPKSYCTRRLLVNRHRKCAYFTIFYAVVLEKKKLKNTINTRST